jgi:thiol-disulfide isomerase/thioredoxin
MFHRETKDGSGRRTGVSLGLRVLYGQEFQSSLISLTLFLTVATIFSGFAWSTDSTIKSISNPTEDCYIPIPHPATMLLSNMSVHRELQLESHQYLLLEKALDNIQLRLWQLRDESPEKRNNKAKPLLQQLQEKLKTILSKQQLDRYRQLVWQRLGIYVYQEPKLQNRLQLNSHQRIQIQNTFRTLKENLSSINHSNESSPVSQRRSKSQNLIARAQQDIQDLLKGRQRNRLGKIFGRPYDFGQVQNIACKAPEFQVVETWLNSHPLRRDELLGKVTVIHFYAFGCINCVRNLPHYNRWVKRFPAGQFQMVGIHRPETQLEQNLEQVKQKAADAGMHYPIAVDNKGLNWDVWANRIWPSIYLIDKYGYVRYWWYGELNWQGIPSEKWMRSKIKELLRESYLSRKAIPPVK